MKYCPTCRLLYPVAQSFCLEDGALLSLQDPYHLVGRTLVDRYQIEALVGIGGMGAVYRAQHLGLDHHIAFKILQPNLALGNERMLALFEREAKLAGRISHECVARVMDAGRTSEGIAYIAMEWLQGRTLEEEISAHSPLSLAHTANVLGQVISALEEAHANQIIHRDLKPANIMLVRRPKVGDTVKVVDFGIGKVISNSAKARVSQVMGTPHYASPEQLSLGALIDERSDLYSLGVILFRMLTGKLPYTASSMHELLHLQLTAAPRPLRDLRPDLPLAVEQLVNCLLAHDPNQRPARAGEISEALDRALATLNQSPAPGAQPPFGAEPQRGAKTVPNAQGQFTVPSAQAPTSPGVYSADLADAQITREQQEQWATLIEEARKHGRTGNLLVLAEEAPTWELQLAAHRTAGNALLRLGQFVLALEQYEKALTINPADLESRRQKATILGRLGQRERGLQAIIKDYPNDAKTWGRLGRVEKDAWLESWQKDGRTVEQMRAGATAEANLLRKAIDAYFMGFCLDPGYHYPGINTLTLRYVLQHLTGTDERPEERQMLEGGVHWAAYCALKKNPADYWARATLGELEILTGDQERIEAAYEAAVAVAENNWFALDSSRQQLRLLQDLGFRPPEVAAALKIIDRALNRLQAPEAGWMPRQVFLFSGHMIDRPDRAEPRFPPDKEPVAAAAIARQLDALGAGPQDLAICGGACGGDLLFAAACLERGLSLRLHLPFDEPTFLHTSVSFAGEAWPDRYFRVKAHPQTRRLIMPEELGPPPKGTDPYVRANRWQFYTALAHGPERVRFICLWDGKEDDGPGGTKYMYDTVRQYAGQVHVIDTTKLW